MSGNILIVDDEAATRRMLAIALRGEGYQVTAASSGAEALRCLEETAFDVVITDLMMPGLSGKEISKDAGIELLGEIKRREPDTEVILLTGYASVDSAVEGMKRGAFDYIEKSPSGIAPKLFEKVKQALERRGEKKELESLRERLRLKQTLVGQSRVMDNVCERIRKIAPTNATVLITGETGTGKELVAREIHRLSQRKDEPFVPVNCSALPADLFESELFGHVKGAFTDAASTRRGLFEEADGGSFFMDEIGDMPETLQAKLLRVLEERTIRRMGGNTPIPVDVRIIAATNQNLPELVAQGKFRKDLYYRLNVVTIHIPPLRERREDIPLLVRHFLDQLTGQTQQVVGFDPEAKRALQQYDYPGNVRELRNAVESALAIASDKLIHADDLPPVFTQSQTATPETPAPLSSEAAYATPPASVTSIAEAEEALIRQAVVEHKGNLEEAARQLGISRTTLWRRMKSYKIR